MTARGGRQGGGFQTAHGDVEFTNIGTEPCTLVGVPKIKLLGAHGAALPVLQRVVAAPQAWLKAAVLRPRQGSAWLALSWENWCRKKPGPLRVLIILPKGAGTVRSSFDGPPDYNYLPGCIDAKRPSSIGVIAAYASQV